MNAHAAADPGIHADESGWLDLFDVDRFGPIQNRQVAGKAGLFHQMAHDGQRNLAHINPAESAAAEAQDLQSDAVFAAALVSIQVTLGFECAQDVARRTLWNLELAADLGVAQAFWLLGNRFQHGESAFDGNRGRFVFGGHRQIVMVAKPYMDNKMNVCSTYCTMGLTGVSAHRTIRQYTELLFSILNSQRNPGTREYDANCSIDHGNRNATQSHQQRAAGVRSLPRSSGRVYGILPPAAPGIYPAPAGTSAEAG